MWSLRGGAPAWPCSWSWPAPLASLVPSTARGKTLAAGPWPRKEVDGEEPAVVEGVVAGVCGGDRSRGDGQSFCWGVIGVVDSYIIQPHPIRIVKCTHLAAAGGAEEGLLHHFPNLALALAEGVRSIETEGGPARRARRRGGCEAGSQRAYGVGGVGASLLRRPKAWLVDPINRSIRRR